MSNNRSLQFALTRQRLRLQQLIEAHGKFDPDHPMQAYSLRRIEYLEKQIEKEKEAAP